MSSIQEINTQIDEYEKKIKELKQLRTEGYNFMKYFNISSKDHVSVLKGLTVKAEYEYNDHTMDEYGHDATAYLKVTFGDNEYLKIDYKEAQGAGTESRYLPTIECEINSTKKARKLLFKNLEYPYITNTNGSERGDLFSLARACHLYYPNCIKTPISDKNNPVFKLEKLAPMNDIKHDDAHSAMGDVLATVEIAKLLKKKAPNVWKASLMTTNKDKTLQIIKNELTFCTDFFYYGKSFPFVLTFICEHPQWGYPMCFDLKSDPKYYFNLTINQLKKEFKKTPKVIRTIKHKKHPIIMNSSYAINFDSYKEIGLAKLKERAKLIKENSEFAKKVSVVLDDEAREKKDFDSQEEIYAEESIYKKFTSKEDNAIMPTFHKADWKEKFLVLQKFKDERLRYFGKKILYEESPESLPKDEYDSIHKEIALRVLSTNKEKWNTIPRTYSEIDTLRNKFKDDKEKLDILNEINSYIEDMEKIYQKAS